MLEYKSVRQPWFHYVYVNVALHKHHKVEVHIIIHVRFSWVLLYQHYGDAIMDAIAFQITSITNVYSTVCSDADQRKHQSSASMVFVNSPHKGPVTRKMFPFDDDIIRNTMLKKNSVLDKMTWQKLQILPWKPRGPLNDCYMGIFQKQPFGRSMRVLKSIRWAFFDDISLPNILIKYFLCIL